MTLKPTSVRPPTARYVTFLQVDGMQPIVAGQHAPVQRFGPPVRARMEMLERVPEWLNDDQRQRYIDVLKMINSPSLAFRLDEALRRDGVPMSGEERELLQRLRRLRNPAQPGNARVSPSTQDLKKAWGVVARMLLYRLGERKVGIKII